MAKRCKVCYTIKKKKQEKPNNQQCLQRDTNSLFRQKTAKNQLQFRLKTNKITLIDFGYEHGSINCLLLKIIKVHRIV